MEFPNHPQARSTRDNLLIYTTADHKRMVEEGIGIIATVNESVDPDKPTFQLVGDPDDTIMKSYWFKVRCVICPKEVFQLCPPKRNLEANLLNHLYEPKLMFSYGVRFSYNSN